MNPPVLRLTPLLSAVLTAAAASAAFASFAAGAATGTAATPSTTRVIVRFDDSEGRMASARQALASLHGSVKVDLPHLQAVAVELPKASLAALKRLPGVKSVEVDPPRYLQSYSDWPSDGTVYAKGQLVPYGVHMVQADQMPQGDALAGSTTVCIVDSGLDVTHPDLQGIKVTGTNSKMYGAWSKDEIGHGTHIAGTIAAVNNEGVGVVGVLPNKKVSLHIEKIYGVFKFPGGQLAGAAGKAKAARAPGFSSDISAALKRCQNAGAKVYSLSIAGDIKSQAEEDTFNQIYAAGGLFLVAMGNQGTRELWYPAGYAASIGVGAIDANKRWASFSQFPSNGKTELAAPGVDILSTHPAKVDSDYGTASARGSLTVAGRAVPARSVESSKMGTPVTAPMADFKEGLEEDPAMAGKICLIKKRAFTDGFWDAAAQRCQKSGGVGFIFMMDAKTVDVQTSVASDSGGVIPGVSVDRATGRKLLANVGKSATISITPWSYAYFGGTSMATPHAAAAAALLWSYFPHCTNAEIRTALQMGAEDINAPGRDDYTGFGLVRARASHDYLKTHACAADRQAAATATQRTE